MVGELKAGADPVVRRRRVPWLGVLSAVLIVVGLLYVGTITWGESRPMKFCAGVGLVSDQASSSPETAFAEWLATSPEQPSERYWKRSVEDGQTSYTNKTYDGADGYGYMSVQVSNLDPQGRPAPDTWSVAGACVGPGRR